MPGVTWELGVVVKSDVPDKTRRGEGDSRQIFCSVPPGCWSVLAG